MHPAALVPRIHQGILAALAPLLALLALAPLLALAVLAPHARKGHRTFLDSRSRSWMEQGSHTRPGRWACLDPHNRSNRWMEQGYHTYPGRWACLDPHNCWMEQGYHTLPGRWACLDSRSRKGCMEDLPYLLDQPDYSHGYKKHDVPQIGRAHV